MGQKTSEDARFKLCVIGSIGRANIKPFSDLIKIINSLKMDYSIILSCNEQVSSSSPLFHQKNIYQILQDCQSDKFKRNFLYRIFNVLRIQLWISFCEIRVSKKTDIYLLFLGDKLLLPVITGRLLGKKVIIVRGGYSEREIGLKQDILTRIYIPIVWLNFRIANFIVLYSRCLIENWKMKKLERKIIIARRHFINIKKFCIKTPYNERNLTVGYIGVFNQTKNIINFIEAIKILKKRADLTFLVGGSGPLTDTVEKMINQINLPDPERIQYLGWIPHDSLPEQLNKLKLLVIPSFSEGLPNIMLEAMSCGTPVLAMPVGAIPDVISPEKNGYFLESTSANDIADNILKSIYNEKIDSISQHARKDIEKSYTFESALANYENIFKSI